MNSDVLRAPSDRTVPHYDESFRDLQRAKYALAHLDAPPGAGPLLDLGCGTGLLAEHLGRTLVGVDLFFADARAHRRPPPLRRGRGVPLR